jgi:hypothetical protein
MGKKWEGMGKEIMKIEVFEKGIRKCEEDMKNEGINLYEIVLS